MAKNPKAGIDKPTLRVMERMVRMPPKPHEEMRVGKRKRERPKSPKRTRQRPKNVA